ncbi:helix-turn-helix domain-containing protein [Desulforegula conservatrix]|uniref:hypothetical protein n=1 Tax=Desulforegula conservatrix TaxID=153026 RepID=UPI000415E246|nr:hypothetical protein [Desulforegula conservatrix]
MAHITFLALPYCSMSGIVFSIDAFSIANRYASPMQSPGKAASSQFTWDVVTIDGRPVEGEGRVMIQPHCPIQDIRKTDLIFIPGFLSPFDFRGKLPYGLSDWLWGWHRKNALIAPPAPELSF